MPAGRRRRLQPAFAPRGRPNLVRAGFFKAMTGGIWHETYRVRAGEYETVYGMPRIGLGRCGDPVAGGVDEHGGSP